MAQNRSGAMAEGPIILLNGTSSAGKSPLAITLKILFGVIGYKFGVIR
jgi:chloramphenicol 3-O-phosphotransferase